MPAQDLGRPRGILNLNIVKEARTETTARLPAGRLTFSRRRGLSAATTDSTFPVSVTCEHNVKPVRCYRALLGHKGRCVETVLASVLGIMFNSGGKWTGQLWKILERTEGLSCCSPELRLSCLCNKSDLTYTTVHGETRRPTAGAEGQSRTCPKYSGSLFHTPTTHWTMWRGLRGPQHFPPGSEGLAAFHSWASSNPASPCGDAAARLQRGRLCKGRRRPQEGLWGAACPPPQTSAQLDAGQRPPVPSKTPPTLRIHPFSPLPSGRRLHPQSIHSRNNQKEDQLLSRHCWNVELRCFCSILFLPLADMCNTTS